MAVAAMLALAGCGGNDEEVRTVTVRDRETAKRVERFAYREVERQARKTCAAVPPEVLMDSFESVSADRGAAGRRPLNANDIALMYAEDVRISPVPLQRAAYDGCIAGLKRRP
jgi:hypothetical protein